jgi:SNF family Na+-dependent transporter
VHVNNVLLALIVGAFLIPYVLAMVLCGYPLMFIEMALGQFGGRSVVEVWKACPLFEGTVPFKGAHH